MPSARVADAVAATIGGILLALEARPARNTTRFPAGYDAWRHRVRIDVAEDPVDGAANRAVVAAVASFFDVAQADVTLTEGASSRRKRVRVAGVTVEAAADRLARALAEDST